MTHSFLYELNWTGKSAAKEIAKQAPNIDVNIKIETNNIICADNIEVLKLLKTQNKKVKLIYIDPPYNTGKKFIYNDDYSLKEKIKPSNNNQKSALKHINWLNMIYPRIVLAQEILCDDGVIFISISDIEYANLKLICNEIFGESNFIASIVWEKSYAPVNLKKHFSESHDYILCYAKDINKAKCNGLPRTEEANERYQNPDNDHRGNWKSSDLSVGPAISEKIYPIKTPSGRIVFPPSGYCWRLTESKFIDYVKDNRIWFGENGNNVPSIKRFLNEVKQTITPMTIWKYQEVGHSQSAKQHLKKLFDGKSLFDYPKPVELIQRCIELYTDKNDLILDFFAGSGTTAEAVIKINATRNSNRRFICVQNYEDKQKEGISLFEIIKERIIKSSQKYNIKVDFDELYL